MAFTTSSVLGIMPPTRLHMLTGFEQPIASFTSSFICPMLSSTVRKPFTFAAALASGSFGTG